MTASSPHFASREFACRHCGDVKVSRDLLDALERLREKIGRPLPIVSGYRCFAHNRAVGGAMRSQHRLGRAADIPAGYASPHQASSAGFVGIGTKGAWAVHLDVRRGRAARWTY